VNGTANYFTTVLKLRKLLFQEGVFTTLRTSVGLLAQPNHLQLLISSVKSESSMDLKLTPQLLEIQTK